MKKEVTSLPFLSLVLSFVLMFLALFAVKKIVTWQEVQREQGVSVDVEYSLVQASSLGNFERVKKLIEEMNVSANVVDPLGRRPILAALESGNLKIAEYLLDHGADINARDIRGNTALILAARFDRIKPFKFLLENKAQVNLVSDLGRSALFEASLVANLEMVEELLKRKADLNVKDYFGNTIVHAAVMGQNSEVLHTILMEAREDERTNKLGQTPQDLARHLGNKVIEEALIKQAEEANE